MTQESSVATIRVMLVDDHLTMLWGLQQLINAEKPGMEVVGTASDVSEVVGKAISCEPDVILLDVDLGEHSCLEILPALMQATSARVILLTGIRNAETLDTSMRLGIHGLVRKEEPAEVLLNAIHKVHAGELWFDRAATAKILNALRERNEGMTKQVDKLSLLTTREKQVLAALVRESGQPNKVIAQRLFMSENTLRNHLTAIYHKLGVGNRLGLYVFAVENRLGDPTC